MTISFQRQIRKLSSQQHKRQIMADINVTPMVDVMLVLLVIFMVTAPLLSIGIEVDLPKAHAPSLQNNSQPLTVSIDANGKIHIQKTEVSLKALGSRLMAITGANLDMRIYVRGDTKISYGRVIEVMGAINQAGFSKAALVTQIPQPHKKMRSNRKN